MRGAIVLLVLIFFLLVLILIFLPPVSPSSSPSREVKNKPLKKELPHKRGKLEGESAKGVGGRKEHPKRGGKLVIIIDDAGYSLKLLKPFLNFRGKITISVLPNLRYSKESAREILKAGKGLLLHLPMEPENGMDPGPGAIFVGDSREEIFRKLDRDFNSVPGALGANNHMGSKATASSRVMEIVMEYFHIRNKYFIDSKTTSESRAREAALKWQVPYLARDVFLDNTPGEGEIEKWVLKGMEIARRKGYAILIGHVKNPQILDVLQKVKPLLSSEGFSFSEINDLIKSLTNKSFRASLDTRIE